MENDERSTARRDFGEKVTHQADLLPISASGMRLGSPEALPSPKRPPVTPPIRCQPRPGPAWWAPAAILAVAGALAYANSLRGPFLLDDAWNIVRNPSLRHLGQLGNVLSPPANLGVAGRPLYNLSFALNYAAGGTAVLGYHLVNGLIHLLAALALFGIVRRTLRGRLEEPTPVALAIAGLWLLHPVQTASVTYISERSESLMGLFYLLTLYCFIRHAEPAAADARRWGWLAVLACLAGTATKEVMVTAPILVLLYDRTFLAGDFGSALRQRPAVYAGLACSWILLVYLMAGSHEQGVGFGLGASAWNYALTECRALTHYLRLAVWPHPLVFDYDLALDQRWSAVAGDSLLLAAALAVSLLALWRWPAIGFVACSFFLLLAPTSSFVPVAGQPLAENRLYLPLAALLTLLVLGLRRGPKRWIDPLLLALALLAAGLTYRRNRDYASDLTIWRDTVAKCPASPRAHSNLGVALFRHGDKAAARAEVAEAVRLRPGNALNRLLFGNLLAEAGQIPEAVAQYREAVRADPNLLPAREALQRLAP